MFETAAMRPSGLVTISYGFDPTVRSRAGETASPSTRNRLTTSSCRRDTSRERPSFEKATPVSSDAGVPTGTSRITVTAAPAMRSNVTVPSPLAVAASRPSGAMATLHGWCSSGTRPTSCDGPDTGTTCRSSPRRTLSGSAGSRTAGLATRASLLSGVTARAVDGPTAVCSIATCQSGCAPPAYSLIADKVPRPGCGRMM